MSLIFGSSPWLLALCTLGAALLTFWTYGRSRPLIPFPKRFLFILLRFFALFLVLFLLFEPILRHFTTEEREPVLAVLIDNSESAGFQQEGNALKETLNQLNLNDIKGKIKVYRFDGNSKVIEDFTPDSLKQNGARTDIDQALRFVREDLGDENLGGVMLLSDGQYNTGRNPIYQAARFPVPVHTIVVGDTTRQQDVQLRRALTNEVAYVDTELPVQIGVRASGYSGRTATVTLREGNTQLASTTIQLASGNTETIANLSFTPKQPGLKRLTATITQFEGELTYANNITSFTVQVLENKLNVLVLGGVASPDLSTLEAVLGSDPNIKVSSYIQKGQGTFYEGSFPDLSPFDAIVLAGYPGPGSVQANVQKIAEAGNQGKAILFLMGRQTNLNLVRNILGDVLPARPQIVRQGFNEAQFVTTAQGSVHPVLEIPLIEPDALRLLPPLALNQSRWQVSADAITLSTAKIQGVVLDDPVLVIRSRGNTRSVALLGADTWRWRNVPEDLKQIETFWQELLSNMLRWVTTRQDDRPVRVRPVRTLFSASEPVQFVGQVYDESLNPVERANVQVTVTAPDGNRYPYTMNAQGSGRYFIDVGNLPEGTYTYNAIAKQDSKELGTDTGAFAVGALSLEFQETTANALLMRQLAQRSGGLFLQANEANTFATQLMNSNTFKPLQIKQEQETELWTWYYILIAIIVFLTAEWFLRKRNGMV